MEDIHELLKNLFKDTLQKILEAEFNCHLDYKKFSMGSNSTGYNRNRYVNAVRNRKGKFGNSKGKFFLLP
ncbi:MAG: hypothetical protein A4E52_00541 [Pelotomaculum sp. PtaB.Bin013]|uniref:hypothetical protein n=1 Tax=Pelotomaculum isophthalicicum TaxID=342448 RepID=UPI0009D05AD6|nr:MAG: hypothetical protein A4E52_00541 [Pelotomaculum sp. PtaB.Bin013]